MSTVKSVFGVILLGVAIYLLERLVPGWVALLLWAALFIGVAAYLGVRNRHGNSAERLEPTRQRSWRGLARLRRRVDGGRGERRRRSCSDPSKAFVRNGPAIAPRSSSSRSRASLASNPRSGSRARRNVR